TRHNTSLQILLSHRSADAKKRTATPKPGSVRLTFIAFMESRALSRSVSAFFTYSIAKNGQGVKYPPDFWQNQQRQGADFECSDKPMQENGRPAKNIHL
ncbi:MAG: hypothetical protein J6B77_03375, partial [Clostridia bacterium]|nr:hypothetical protein [Clostridia bacterium]